VISTLTSALCDGPEPVGGAIHRCEELLESAGDDRLLDATINRRLSALLAMAGRVDEATERVRRSDRIFADRPNPEGGAHRILAAETKELTGDLAGAEHDLREMWTFYCDHAPHDPDVNAMTPAYHLALLYCDQGRWDDAGRCLEYGRDVPVPAYFRREAVLALAARARLTAHRGDPAEALGLAQHAVELADQSDMLNLRGRLWAACAEVHRAAGRHVEADAAFATAVRLYEAKGNVAAAASLRAAAT